MSPCHREQQDQNEWKADRQHTEDEANEGPAPIGNEQGQDYADAQQIKCRQASNAQRAAVVDREEQRQAY